MGFEGEDDLMPDTCPKCFERRIAPVFSRYRTVPALIAGLIEAGCKPDRIRPYIEQQARALGL